MAQLDDAVLDEINSRGERLLADELVEFAEKYHRSDEPGVPRDLVDGYLDELEGEAAFDIGPLREQLDEDVTADRTFVDTNAVYEVGDGRVSSFPASWHETLDDDATLPDLVYVMTHGDGETPGSAASQGVAKYDLYTAAEVFLGLSRNESRDRLKDLRAEGVLVADADQHPRAGVSLAEESDIDKDRFDKPGWGERSGE